MSSLWPTRQCFADATFNVLSLRESSNNPPVFVPIFPEILSTFNTHINTQVCLKTPDSDLYVRMECVRTAITTVQ